MRLCYDTSVIVVVVFNSFCQPHCIFGSKLDEKDYFLHRLELWGSLEFFVEHRLAFYFSGTT